MTNMRNCCLNCSLETIRMEMKFNILYMNLVTLIQRRLDVNNVVTTSKQRRVLIGNFPST